MRILAAILLAAVSSLYAQSAGFKIVLAGDSILNRKLSVYKDPSYLALFDTIRHADAAFTNFETLIHNFEYPGASVSGGAYMASPPWVVDELKWAGFNLLGVANNHAFDYGPEGMRSTARSLDAAGLVHAGTGENLALARAAVYMDTAGGRVALVACASTFTPGSLAGEQRPDLKGRPGLSPLRFSTTYTVDASTLEGLRKLSVLSAPEGAPRNNNGPVHLGGATYQAGDTFGIHTAPLKQDLEGIVASIRNARRQADWVIVSIHTHEGKPGKREQPADFLEAFAHAAIDAGADVFVGHGPHVLRPIEIYKGKPIFYSMANFAFENETMEFQPAESYQDLGLLPSSSPADYYDARSKNDTRGFPVDPLIWQSVVAEVTFNPDRTPKEILLHPISLGFHEPRPQRGRPRLASPELSKQIIDRLAELSSPRGAKIDFVNGIGVVELDSKRGSQ